MQVVLLVLVLMGQCSCSCQLYEYHFIKEKKTWDEAQDYCREKHTDLARVFDMKEAESLNKSMTEDEAWIGLHYTTNQTWLWSLPGTEVIRSNDSSWATNEPNNVDSKENCVLRAQNGWKDYPCDECNCAFVCYNEAINDFYFINELMNWYQAQRFCREKHTDLISGRQEVEDQGGRSWNGTDFWIGLFRNNWMWSDGRPSSFRTTNWHQDSQTGDDGQNGQKKCAVTKKDGTWMKTACDQEKPFICYDDGLILIKENKTWEEAFSYCRDKHHDLVSILNLQQHQWVQGLAKEADTPHVWLGLRYTCTLGFWFWITDERVEYTSWESQEQVDECGMSGAMETGRQQNWVKRFDVEKFNFICFKK